MEGAGHKGPAGGGATQPWNPARTAKGQPARDHPLPRAAVGVGACLPSRGGTNAARVRNGLACQRVRDTVVLAVHVAELPLASQRGQPIAQDAAFHEEPPEVRAMASPVSVHLPDHKHRVQLDGQAVLGMTESPLQTRAESEELCDVVCSGIWAKATGRGVGRRLLGAQSFERSGVGRNLFARPLGGPEELDGPYNPAGGSTRGCL